MDISKNKLFCAGNLNRRDFIKACGTGLCLGAALTGSVALKSKSEISSVEPNYYQIPNDKLEDRLTIVHLSDLHLDEDNSRDYVPQMVNNCNADLVLMTGDYLNYYKENPVSFSRLTNYVNKIKSREGVYACMGNWDWGFEDFLFKNTGVKVLRDKGIELKTKSGKVNLVGMDFCAPGIYLDKKLTEIFSSLDNDNYSILLEHSPDLIEEKSVNNNFDLYLAGHTHGGQVRIPFLRLFQDGKGKFPYAGALITMSNYGSKYQSGMYDVGKTKLYVNKGVGVEGSAIPIRFFCRPEIAIFEIGPKNKLKSLREISPSGL